MPESSPAVEAPPEPGENVTAAEIVQRVDPSPMTKATYDLILSDDEIRRTWRTAAALAQSGMFKGAAEASQAFAKILIGRDLGISPTQALMTVDLVEGSIQLRGVLLAGFLRRHPTYDYRIEGTHDETTCTVVIERKRDDAWIDAGSWTFTVDDAAKAQLLKGADKPKAAWNAHRKNMLMWRAMANAVRAHAPDLFGGVPVYVDDEIPKPEPSLTAGTGDGEAQHVDLGPKVEAVLKRAADLGHAGLADRATAEMVLMGQPPDVVERWCVEAAATLDAMPEVTDADVVADDPDAGHDGMVVVQGRKYRALCPSCGPLSEWGPKAAAEQAAEAHLVETTPDEPEAVDAAPVDDPVEAANRAEVLREQAATLLDEADDAKAAGDDAYAQELADTAAGLVTEANAISNGEQGSLDLGA